MITSNSFVRGKFDTARETAFGSITSSFTKVGTSFESPFSIFYVQNFTNQLMDFSISFEGLTTTFTLAANGIICGDMISNQVQISVGESIWVKARGSLPASGFVQFSAVTPI